MTEHEETYEIAEGEINEFCESLRLECARYGDQLAANQTTTEFREGLERNHGETLVANAASGAIAALAELRQACGLPIFA